MAYTTNCGKRAITLCCSLIIVLLFACNRIETGNTLGKEDIAYVRSLNLLDKDETIIKFYSEYKNKIAGNFFTNKRMAKYWTDDKEHEDDNYVSFAYYRDIKSIKTVYHPGLSYCPYMLVTKMDDTSFKVCVQGGKRNIKSFFDDAIKLWNQHKQDNH